MDRLDIVYTELNRSVTAPSGLLSGPVRCFYTGPDRSFTASSGLFQWAIAKIDRECFKENFIDNASSRFTAFSNLSPRMVIISL